MLQVEEKQRTEYWHVQITKALLIFSVLENDDKGIQDDDEFSHDSNKNAAKSKGGKAKKGKIDDAAVS